MKSRFKGASDFLLIRSDDNDGSRNAEVLLRDDLSEPALEFKDSSRFPHSLD